jgi:hypothetical protein
MGRLKATDRRCGGAELAVIITRLWAVKKMHASGSACEPLYDTSVPY